MFELAKFSALVDEVLDMASIENLEFRVKPDFDEQLSEIGQRMTELERLMGKQISKVRTPKWRMKGTKLTLLASPIYYLTAILNPNQCLEYFNSNWK